MSSTVIFFVLGSVLSLFVLWWIIIVLSQYRD